MTQHSVARAYSIIQEVQELRDKARKLSERNAELAKALTLTRQELTKARTAQNAVFSGKGGADLVDLLLRMLSQCVDGPFVRSF
uniref:Uncharacterized protein n=1 Tax=Hyaloperonospora arabidopsidis (strain Emoy2) TaxID=559515 RepID=M4BQ42_HYAAE